MIGLSTVALNEKFLSKFVSDAEMDSMLARAEKAHKTLFERSGAGNDYTGWVYQPENFDTEEIARIKKAGEKIKKNCDVLVVIGIGGSYLGARAAIEFLASPFYNAKKKDTPDIYFAGCNISAKYISELIEICRDKDVCVNIISKSGTTTEPALAFRIFKQMLEEKYGKNGAKERIFATTDKARGTLKELADKEGYESFVIPDDIGGRYSVMTAVGLLPMAVAGIDLDALLSGAAAAHKELKVFSKDNAAVRYAAIRNILLEKGRHCEIFASAEPSYQMMNEWWKQLFGESEGKDNKGIFPASVIYSTDLHSLGQYIQDGTRMMFETILDIKDTGCDMKFPTSEDKGDGLTFLENMPIDDVNSSMIKAAAAAHTEGNVPVTVLELAKHDAYSLGYLMYFFFVSCGVSGYILGVNPFNQPGVEAYKKNMFALLGKPGYEELAKELKAKLK